MSDRPRVKNLYIKPANQKIWDRVERHAKKRGLSTSQMVAMMAYHYFDCWVVEQEPE